MATLSLIVECSRENPRLYTPSSDYASDRHCRHETMSTLILWGLAGGSNNDQASVSDSDCICRGHACNTARRSRAAECSAVGARRAGQHTGAHTGQWQPGSASRFLGTAGNRTIGLPYLVDTGRPGLCGLARRKSGRPGQRLPQRLCSVLYGERPPRGRKLQGSDACPVQHG